MNEVWPAMYSAAARPSRLRAAPAKKRIWSTIGGISSSMVSWKGLPVFSHSARTRSSARASRASAMRMRARLRSDGVVRRQDVKASRRHAQGVVDVGGPRDGCLGEGLTRAGVDEGCAGPVLGVEVGAPDEVLQLAHAAPFLASPWTTGSQKIMLPTSVSAILAP